MNEVMGEWKKLHIDELHSLYLSRNIISQMKSKTMKRVEHVARMGGERKLYNILVESPKKIDYSKDRGVDGRMGLEWIFSRLAWGCGVV
jgi:hypothetical protein